MAFCACLLLHGLLASSPGWAHGWTLGNHTITNTDSNAQSGSGCGAGAGTYGYAGTWTSIDGNATSGYAGTWTSIDGNATSQAVITASVARTFTRNGNPVNLDVWQNASVDGSVSAYSNPPNGAAGSDARSINHGDTNHWPNWCPVDFPKSANQPNGAASDSYYWTNWSDPVQGRKVALYADATFTGSIFCYTNGVSQNNAGCQASADGQLQWPCNLD
jgi:hypothetical protein